MSDGPVEFDLEDDVDLEDGDYEPEEFFDEDEPQDTSPQILGSVVNHHSKEQLTWDADQFWRRMEYGRQPENLPRKEPGDMSPRGVWTFNVPGSFSSFSYAPYSQFSCAYGVANVYKASDLDILADLVKKHGRIFIFTVVSKHVRDAVEARPKEFKPLCSQTSWMNSEMVTLYAAVSEEQ